ncbi:hypothetical protein [Oceanospirillum linum]|uniref:Uncharacterized protein n=1 Tax=Oceanospirillum linum TaxID=966 RepID=A0A1T1HAI9_OCELI|nr:hypothetical protein [Oceanospirillum linum]OOV86878.1 hypothetical protein BTA35_0211315 [Oceanospirillum linum]SEG20121.1 hypothetical protein SAMN04489856_10672 [Oleiphilus messinensis]SMP24356.1 hypothetical protein SAMN06264348_10571 [Oceanospirillum linum]
MWGHNIFNDLVQGDDDFVGMVAYSVYKQEKVRWIQKHHDDSGSYPTPEEMQTYFYNQHSRPESIKRYRDEAESQLNTFIQATLAEELLVYQQEIRDSEIIKNVKTPLHKRLIEGVVAGLISTALVALISMIIWLNSIMESSPQNPSLPESIKQKIESQAQQSTSSSSEN